MQAEGRVGPVVAADGTLNPARLERTGGLVVADAHGRYREAVARGGVYGGAISGQVTSVGLATGYTGLCLSNPPGSGVNLSLLKVGYSFIVVFAAGAVIGLMVGWNATEVTHTTPVTPRNKLLANPAAGAGKLDSAATLPIAPTLDTILASGDTGAITTAPFIPGGLVDIDGLTEIPPGGFAAIFTSTASGAAGGAFSMAWEEIKQ